MDEAIARLKLAADAGADVCFIEGVKSKELLESTVAALAPKPVSLSINVLSIGSILTMCLGFGERYLWWPHPIIHNQRSGRHGCQDN